MIRLRNRRRRADPRQCGTNNLFSLARHPISCWRSESLSGECMKFPRISTLLLQAVVPAVLIVLVSYPAGLLAQTASADHVVSSKVLQQQVEASSAARQKNVETLKHFMSTPTAEKA